MNDLPAVKIKMMKGSFRCLVFGLLGLLPLIGVPFAMAALELSSSPCRLGARKSKALEPGEALPDNLVPDLRVALGAIGLEHVIGYDG